jgi:hypothetical protein
MRKTLTCFLATLAGALALVPTAALADGNPNEGWTRVDQIINLSFIEINSCAGGELVTLTGQASLTTRTRVEPDGSLSVKESVSMSMTGVGDSSGADYTLSDASVNHVTGINQLPFSLILNRVSKLTDDGVPDMDLHFKVHLTINADGTITQNVNYVTMNCGN